jgi:hypothetical protein
MPLINIEVIENVFTSAQKEGADQQSDGRTDLG